MRTNAELLRTLRAEARADGRCSTCRARVARPGRMTCQDCVDRSNACKRANKGRLCLRCCGELQGERQGMSYCTPCSDVLNEKSRARAKHKLAAGVCSYSGCHRPLAPGHTACLQCLDDRRDRVMALSRQRGRKPKRCPICGPDSPGGHDRRTHDRYVARAAAWTKP